MQQEVMYSSRREGRPQGARSALVAMPVFNEASTLPRALGATRRYCHDCFIAIDDGSTDDSYRILANETRGPILHSQQNGGYGSAVLAALAYADRCGYEFLLTLDADLQHDPALLPVFLSLAGKADLVSGSRYLPNSPALTGVPRFRAIGNAFYRQLVADLLGLHLSDVWCGMKLYRVAAFRGAPRRATGYEFPLELWPWISRRGLSVIETAVPLVYYDRDFERDEIPGALRHTGALFFRTFVGALEAAGFADRRRVADRTLHLLREGAFELTSAEMNLLEKIVSEVADSRPEREGAR